MDQNRTLLETLHELSKDDFELFKWHLQQPASMVGDLKPLAAGPVEMANPQQTVNLIISKYPNGAKEIVTKVLNKINRNDLVLTLEIPNASGQKPQPQVERPQSTLATDASGVQNPLIYQATADGPVRRKKTEEIEVEDDHYKLTSKPGLCVIINNENFTDPKAKRHGSKKDAVNLAETFSWLGFRVLMCKDQTMSQMQVTLERFSSLKDLTELQESNVKEWSMDEGEFTNPTIEDPPQHRDAFVCCIMSHGDKGAVFGTDGKPLLINDITTTFNGKACPVLLNKPKVFFIQACQGEGIQCGIAADSSPELQEAPKIPVDADFLVFMATTENNKAFRSRIDGSWFIQSVCKQLGEGSQRGKDLLAILTAVNKEMADKEVSLDQIDAKSTLRKELEKAGQEEIKQMSVCTKNTLRKLLVFSPISE